MMAARILLLLLLVCSLQMVVPAAGEGMSSVTPIPPVPDRPSTTNTNPRVGDSITLSTQIDADDYFVQFLVRRDGGVEVKSATWDGSRWSTAHSRSTEGTDVITARAVRSPSPPAEPDPPVIGLAPRFETTLSSTVAAQGPESEALTITWVAAQPPLSVELTPADSAGPTEETFTWTATVVSGGVPVPGASVEFVGQMSGQEGGFATGVTDSAGLVSHSHERSSPGVETLSVTVTDSDRVATARGSREWLAAPEPLVVELTPEASAGEVGSSFDWTATVTSGGGPVSDVPVSFLGQLEGQDDESASSTTNEEGQVSHSHSRSTPGLETLRVVAGQGDAAVADTGEREWLQEDDPPPAVVTPDVPPPDEEVRQPDEEPQPKEEPEEPEEPPSDGLTPVPPTDDLGTNTPTGGSAELDSLELAQPSVVPGGDLVISGAGCPPGGAVDLALAGLPLGASLADSDGRFTARVAVPDVPLGQYVVTATCGDAVGETFVDLVVPTSMGTGGAQTVTTALVLTFFVLLGSSLVRGISGQGVTATGH